MSKNAIKMEGVTEYCEGYPVELDTFEDGGPLCIVGTNEGGHNGTYINVQELIDWLKKNRPFYFV